MLMSKLLIKIIKYAGVLLLILIAKLAITVASEDSQQSSIYSVSEAKQINTDYANMANKKIDNTITMESAFYDIRNDSTVFTYILNTDHSAVTTVLKSESKTASFIEKMRIKRINYRCTVPESRADLELGLYTIVKYMTPDHVYVGEYTVTIEDCKKE